MSTTTRWNVIFTGYIISNPPAASFCLQSKSLLATSRTLQVGPFFRSVAVNRFFVKMTFSSNPNNWRNENLPTNTGYRPVGLSQPTSIPPPPAPIATCSNATYNYSFAQGPAPGNPVQNPPAEVFENTHRTSLCYSPAVPGTQAGYTIHHHEVVFPAASTMVHPMTLLTIGQLDNGAPPTAPSMFLSNFNQPPILSPRCGQHGMADSTYSSTDSTVGGSMMIPENGSAAKARPDVEMSPISDISATKAR